MDWQLTTSIASTALAVGAFALSVVTYVRAEREKVRYGKREFLTESNYLSDRFLAGMMAFKAVQEMSTFEEQVVPVLKDLLKLKSRSTRWKDDPLYAEFNNLLTSIADAGEKFELFFKNQIELPELAASLDEAMRSAAKYSAYSRDRLLAL